MSGLTANAVSCNVQMDGGICLAPLHGQLTLAHTAPTPRTKPP